jgi:hypothetical protein
MMTSLRVTWNCSKIRGLGDVLCCADNLSKEIEHQSDVAY